MRISLVVLVVLAGAVGCADRTTPSAVASAALLAPPTQPFVAPQPWQSKRKPGPPVAPPDLARETWHVLVDQYEPHQTKTPVWQALPAQSTVELAMPEGSRFRCIAPPLEIEPETNDFETELEDWLLSRDVLCSSDGWRSWHAYAYRVRVLPDGTHRPQFRSDGWLNERASDGSIRHTVVSLRAQEPRRAATTGPPQVLSALRAAE